MNEVGPGRIRQAFDEAMGEVALYLIKNTDSWVIDTQLIKKIEEEIIRLKDMQLDEDSKNAQQKSKQATLKVMKCLEKFASENGIECNFVILKASQFSSGFGKTDFSKINIVFSSGKDDFSANIDVVASLEAKERDGENFFYLFYKRQEKEADELNNLNLCKMLLKEFI